MDTLPTPHAGTSVISPYSWALPQTLAAWNQGPCPESDVCLGQVVFSERARDCGTHRILPHTHTRIRTRVHTSSPRGASPESCLHLLPPLRAYMELAQGRQGDAQGPHC